MHRIAELVAPSSRSGADDLTMVITEKRVAYRGLLGAPATRNLGALTIYVSLNEAFAVRIEGEAETRQTVALLPPHTPHLIKSPDRVIGVLLIEPECIDPETLGQLPEWIREPDVASRLAHAFRTCRESTLSIKGSSEALDEVFFGRRIEPRVLDPRIAMAIAQIQANPCEQFFAASCAELTGLSFSRFVHVFKAEIGLRFRAYCAWKRARALLPYVSGQLSLTRIAMKTGYPDSTHFSHSIRRIYGLRPKDIINGSRRLAIASS